MENFENFDSLPSGRPQFLPNEIEVLSIICLGLINEQKKLVQKNGNVMLTTHRVFFLSDKFKKCIHLEKIKSVVKGGGVFSKNKAEISFNDSNKVISFKLKKGLDKLIGKIKEKISEKKWEVKKEVKKKRQFSTKNAGLSGIERKIRKTDNEQKNTLKKAFGDLDTLMKKAEDLVKIADHFSKRNLTDQENNEFSEMLDSVGIGSVVSKHTSGNKFHQELARQLVDFFSVILKRHKGIITLSDAYCIYNRARGTDLISPDDMIKACSLFKQLNLPLEFRKFESGLMVIVGKSHSDEEMKKKILGAIEKQENKCISAVDLSPEIGMNVLMTKVVLEDSENRNIVARDEGEIGVFYYNNLFPEFEPNLPF